MSALRRARTQSHVMRTYHSEAYGLEAYWANHSYFASRQLRYLPFHVTLTPPAKAAAAAANEICSSCGSTTSQQFKPE